MDDFPGAIHSTAAAPGTGAAARNYNFAERLIVAALRNARVRFRDEPDHWDWMLGFLDATERDIVRRILDERPPTIRYGYARDTDKWPIISVVLASEAPSTDLIGDVIELANGLIVEGEVREQRLDITIYADSPDLALYLYHWVNYAMQAHVQWFQNEGLQCPAFVAGGELAPDPRYVPETCYLRRVTWSFRGEVTAAIPMRPPSRDLYAMNETATVAGHVGGVSPVRVRS